MNRNRDLQIRSELRPVLVIEDSEEDYDTVVEATQRCGIKNRIVHAVSAEEALQHFPTAGSSEPFAFILLDQNLPGLSGIDFLRELRQSPVHGLLPVVVYTTSTSPRDRDGCYGAGANAYHVKSVRFEQCLQTLSEVFLYWLGSAVIPDPPHERRDERNL